jgi:hypothetical protein
MSAFDDPEHWRQRAEQSRRLADQMNDAISKETMLTIAKDYDRLAERAEQRSKASPLAVIPPPPESGAAGPA